MKAFAIQNFLALYRTFWRYFINGQVIRATWCCKLQQHIARSRTRFYVWQQILMFVVRFTTCTATRNATKSEETTIKNGLIHSSARKCVQRTNSRHGTLLRDKLLAGNKALQHCCTTSCKKFLFTILPSHET